MLTLTLYFGSVMVAVTCLVPILSQYGRPGSIGSSDIQTSAASNWSATPGRSDGRCDDVAAAAVDLVGERQRDGLAGDGSIEVAVHRDDAR